MNLLPKNQLKIAFELFLDCALLYMPWEFKGKREDTLKKAQRYGKESVESADHFFHIFLFFETPYKLCVKEKRAQRKSKESVMLRPDKCQKGLRYFWSL